MSLSVTACGGDDTGDDDDDDDDDVVGEHTQYVVDSLQLPATTTLANKYAFDINGDGVTENALGGVLAALSGQGLNLQASVDRNVLQGEIVLLADVEATALNAATGVKLRVFLGDNGSPASCGTTPTVACGANSTCTGVNEACGEGDMSFPCGLNLDGNGTFDIAASSPRDSLMEGNIVGGKFNGGGIDSTLTIQLSLVEGSAPITLDLIGALAEIQAVSEDGLMSARLGGAITLDDINNTIIPTVVDIAQNALESGCALQGEECVCEDGSTGGTVQGLFDADGNCEVTETEVRENSIVNAVLTPDLDMKIDATGEIKPNQDGINDALSIGVGFEAVGATFAL